MPTTMSFFPRSSPGSNEDASVMSRATAAVAGTAAAMAAAIYVPGANQGVDQGVDKKATGSMPMRMLGNTGRRAVSSTHREEYV